LTPYKYRQASSRQSQVVHNELTISSTNKMSDDSEHNVQQKYMWFVLETITVNHEVLFISKKGVKFVLILFVKNKLVNHFFEVVPFMRIKPHLIQSIMGI